MKVRAIVVDEVGFVSDGTTEADEKRLYEDERRRAIAVPDVKAEPMNRADRRRTERENRRAAKLAAIQQITRSTRG